MQPASRFSTLTANLIVPTFTRNVKVASREREFSRSRACDCKIGYAPRIRPVAQVRQRVVRANLGRANLGELTWGKLTWEQKHPRRPALGRCLAISGRPFRLDLDHSDFPQRITTEAAPLPVSRLFHQPTLHRIPVQIAQFFPELSLIPDVPIVVSFLPEYAGVRIAQPRHAFRNRQSQPVDCIRQHSLPGLVKREVKCSGMTTYP
jgi:hypothetical protein